MSLSFEEVQQLLSLLPPNTPVTLNVNVDVVANSSGGGINPPPIQSDTYIVDTSSKPNNMAKVFDKASKGSNPIGFVYKDDIVYVDSAKNGYYHIYKNDMPHTDFQPGWVEDQYLRKA